MDQMMRALLKAHVVKMRTGYYETIYGNTAIYRTDGKTAYDVDSQTRIPLMLLGKYLRPLSR
jgi:hypothetical protein